MIVGVGFVCRFLIVVILMVVVLMPSRASAQQRTKYPVTSPCDSTCAPAWWCGMVLNEADGCIRWPAWSLLLRDTQRDSVRMGLPVRHGFQQYQIPIAYNVVVRPLLWASYRRIHPSFQSRTIPRSASWSHYVLIAASFRANTGDSMWLLAMGSTLSDSTGHGRWHFPLLQRLIPDSTLHIRGSDTLAGTPISYHSARTYRSCPSGRDVLQFIADATAYPIAGRGEVVSLADADDLVHDDSRLELGGVCAEAWRWFTGEEPTTRVVPDR